MNEMRYIGRRFTWTNNHVFSKIDRALVNAEWMIRFPKKEVLVLDPNLSDHSPLCIKMDEENFQGPRTFRFLNYIAEHHNFLEVVNKAWQIPMRGSWMNRVWMRLKGMKEGLKQINTKKFRGIDERIKTLRKQLAEVQAQMRSHDHNPTLFAQEKDTKNSWRNGIP
ncbi:uncharacterized protein [Nicotiana sylvestris]|uniref:uncharacterized protein n=1 Tax=Nicotiana sylvestris TaxID=4096 RepID=UPI00388C41FA